MINETEAELIWRVLRGLCLLVFSLWALYMSAMSASNQQWDKATFFLIVMIVINKALDRIYEKNIKIREIFLKKQKQKLRIK